MWVEKCYIFFSLLISVMFFFVFYVMEMRISAKTKLATIMCGKKGSNRKIIFYCNSYGVLYENKLLVILIRINLDDDHFVI